MAQRFQLDDIVYFRDTADKSICYGTISGMTKRRGSDDVLVTIDNVKNIKAPWSSKCSKYSQATISEKACEATEADLYAAIAIEERAAQDIYRYAINSVKDLIEFVLNNDVSGKSFRIECDEPDVADEIRNKRIVFIEKARELLGLTNLPIEFPEQ